MLKKNANSNFFGIKIKFETVCSIAYAKNYKSKTEERLV